MDVTDLDVNRAHRASEPPPDSQIPYVRKRDGRVVSFDSGRISHAIEMAFRAEIGCPFPDPLLSDVVARIDQLAANVVAAVQSPHEADVSVEAIQDEVERQLMAAGAYAVARRYILYRDARARVRDERTITVVDASGDERVLRPALLRSWVDAICAGLVSRDEAIYLEEEVLRAAHRGISLTAIDRAIVLAARTRIERNPSFSRVAARGLLVLLYSESLGERTALADAHAGYATHFANYVQTAVAHELLAPELLTFDLERLGAAIVPERDFAFDYLGLQTLYDRYLIHHREQRLEWPQMFWMRVAMGLALEEDDPNARAIEFYQLMSTFDYCPSTPTLFNSGTRYPQLSSCYLTTVPDDLDGIFSAMRDNALLSKWSGGIGNDWTPVRALGSRIKGTNGLSQGIVPYLKVANDTAVAVNQGGKRKGAVCAYLECWHLDIEEFLDLRKNTGDDRRRTHDMNTALWVPDLFMQRVQSDGDWTLFSPSDVPDLHDLYGKAFGDRYVAFEAAAERGELPLARRIKATELWRKMLTALFETGHPWITFKDPANLRSPQDHAGVVHNSNLCTEITLNTSADEVAVCNLGSVNLPAHIGANGLDLVKLEQTVRTAMRMLDNVIDLNFYPIPQAANANRRHRPVGLGVMGFQDALWKLRIGYDSPAAVTFADQSMEAVSYFSLLASSELAAERGAYPSYAGSKWDRGLLPIDTIDLLEAERGELVDVSRNAALDWSPVRASIEAHGMRNSNCLAIAPTATIANITGVTQSIEPLYTNLYVKSNLSGEFTVVNESLVERLMEQGLWSADLIDELKYRDGSVREIAGLPIEIKEQFPTAFEIDVAWLIACGAARQKWIDQSQSLNLYIDEPSGRKISDAYQLAWRSGLKTTYYLRSRAATQAEKSTIDVNRFGIQPKWMKSTSSSAAIQIQATEAISDDEFGLTCEACQ
ncbi:MAG: ribonucleoside-diphosphate reductase subunit alpha [Thermomicrobiales bacterium]|nr:ribonucleoside-diphosphate reductase subunit alpha [Thermomicrobiales bacterium]